MNNMTINGDQAYIDYKFDPFTVPVLAALIPLIYLLPTMYIVVKIVRKYFQNLWVQKDSTINLHVFSVIVLHLTLVGFEWVPSLQPYSFQAVLYLLTDYTTIRIPATGLITSWCASQQPNHGLKILFLLSVYFNYTAMLFPALLSVLRLVPIYYPFKVDEVKLKLICRKQLNSLLDMCPNSSEVDTSYLHLSVFILFSIDTSTRGLSTTSWNLSVWRHLLLLDWCWVQC